MVDIPGVPRRPVILVILDGFGVNPSKRNNAVAEAETPNLDEYFSRYPHTTLNASGRAVGLPESQMGNSEVGHLTLGAGNIIRQDLVKIDDAIQSGEFFKNTALLNATIDAAVNNKPLHLIGLVSDGGVHSHIHHIEALLKLCQKHQVKPLLHMITDGRDTPPQSALHYLDDINKILRVYGGKIASICGRYYAMDRDKRWDRTERYWRMLLHGKGNRYETGQQVIQHSYDQSKTDEFIQPATLPDFESIKENDPVIFFNFRKDRPRQIVAALSDPNFHNFDRGQSPLAKMTCMMPYDRSFSLPYAFEPEKPPVTIAQTMNEMSLEQFHCAETEKYAHVTYFFNGGRTSPYSGENQLLIPSPSVATYDLKPSMSAKEVADAVVGAIEENRYAFIVVNFANGDMVGHTAKRHATLEAVETLDREASKVLNTAEQHGYSVIMTADHGNCEELIDPFTGEPHTQHTTYPVPCLILDEDNWQLSCSGGLSNVAPTVFHLMGISPPAEMTSDSILLRKLKGKRPVERENSRKLKGVA